MHLISHDLDIHILPYFLFCTDYYKAYLGIAMSFDKMAKYKDAIRYYKKFLELKQFSEDAIFARNRINELRAEYFSKDNSLTLIE